MNYPSPLSSECLNQDLNRVPTEAATCSNYVLPPPDPPGEKWGCFKAHRQLPDPGFWLPRVHTVHAM